MSYVPYLIRKNQGLYFSRLLQSQASLFQITEESSGLILDSTFDLNFLSFILTGDSSLIVDSNNQILLSTAQLKNYVSMRMYYYNPQMFYAQLFSILNCNVYIDLTDRSFHGSGNSNGEYTFVYSKSPAYKGEPFLVSTANPAGYELQNKLVNGYQFSSAWFADEILGLIVGGSFGDGSFYAKSPFYCQLNLSLYSETSEVVLVDFYPATGQNRIRVFVSFSAGSLTVKFRIYYNNTTYYTIQKTIDYSADDFLQLRFWNDSTSFYLKLNDTDAVSSGLPSESFTNPLVNQIISSNGDYNSILGNYFDFLLSLDNCSPSTVEMIENFFNVKYFFEIN